MHPGASKVNSPKFAPDSGGWHRALGWKGSWPAGRIGKLHRERRHAVYAGVSTLQGPPELMDERLRQPREVVLHGAKQVDGFKGMIALGDRRSGKTLGITFWESEEAMRASEEAADRMREETAEAGGDTIAGVERYEVGLFEVES
jgi:heme-degrading monooxygenase HmoA